MNTVHFLKLAVCAGVAVMWAAPAQGATMSTCVGRTVMWYTTPQIHRMRCTIPDSGSDSVNQAYWNGALQWDELMSGNSSYWVRPYSDCTVDYEDEMSEVGIAHPSHFDDDAIGYTVTLMNPCHKIIAADVLVSWDLPFGNPRGNFLGANGRATFVHEFGHFYGFEHEETHSVMRSSTPDLVTGGPQAATLWPNDAWGIRNWYGMQDTTKPNLLPSAMGIVGGSPALLNTGTETICRGSPTNLKFYFGNAGAVDTGSFNIRIRLNTSPDDFAGGTLGTNYAFSLWAFSGSIQQLNFFVPNVPYGDYYVHVDMDRNGLISELREHDNTTVSGKKLRINCG